VRSLLVDTNVVVWLLLGDRPRVSEPARIALEDERNRVVVSAVSVWEIAVKRSLGKLTIEDGWGRALARLGFDALPVTSIHAEAVERLPWHHRDPFDRLLVAQARTEGFALVTADPRLASYDVDVVWSR
jgi:PIN domain nuclease of toxin-antitoxin system